MNPTWRLTFTDTASKEKTRVPYAVAVQNQGPHLEFALRLQFGHVSCDGSFADVPQSLTVDNGWEATFPAGPIWPVRICQSNITAGGVPATVTCVDVPIGFSLGFQRVVSGHGVKGISEASSWRSDGAMAAGGLAALYGIWSVATTPWTWMSLWEELEDMLDDSDARMIFEELDSDGKGFIDREDFRRFLSSQGDGEVSAGEADAIFDALDVSGTGRISFEEFEESLEALAEAMESGELDRMQSGQQFGYPGGPQAYGQPPPGQFVNQMRPFGGAFDNGMGAGRQPGGAFPGPAGGFMGPGPVGPGPRPPSW